MLCSDRHCRVILWGCEVSNGRLTAELAYFASNISTSTVKVTDPEGNVYKINIPKKAINNNFASKTQHYMSEILP